MSDPHFWRRKGVFITGHTGFKGSWLTLWLRQLGAEVTGYALPPDTDPNLFTLAEVGESGRSILADVTDADALGRSLSDASPSIVFHMAAQALVRQSYTDPVRTFATNVMGTVNLLEAVRQAPTVKAVVIVTSDKCYENRESGVAFREDDPMGGYDPYSSSKGCAELATAAYRRSYFNPDRFSDHGVAVASARAGNVIGGGDWSSDRLVPDIVRALSSGIAPKIRNPHAVRPWQHVLEPLSGYMLLAERLFQDGANHSEGWNFGPDEIEGKTVGWVATQAADAWGEGAKWIAGTERSAHEAEMLMLDCSKARDRLGWSPKWHAEQAISETIRWHKRVIDGDSPREVTLQQIAEYERAPALAAAGRD